MYVQNPNTEHASKTTPAVSSCGCVDVVVSGNPDGISYLQQSLAARRAHYTAARLPRSTSRNTTKRREPKREFRASQSKSAIIKNTRGVRASIALSRSNRGGFAHDRYL